MLSIQKLLINYNFSVRNGPIKYICIHDVGAVSTAINNRNYFNSGEVGASADFFIDSKNIIQLIDYIKNYGWSVGDGKGKYGIANNNSLSIEMCLEANLKPSTTTVTNTIELVQKLMKELNIPLERVVRHYDASHKNCPGSFSANNWLLWTEFKKQLIPSVVVKPINKVNYVLKTQQFLNSIEILDVGGHRLKEDGVIGKLTFSALDNLNKKLGGK